MSNVFESRLACGVCVATDYEQIYSADYDKGILWQFLNSYYQGRISSKVLSGAFYRLNRCKNCGFIWQEQHLNDAYMGDLYETWISPDESLSKEQQRFVPLLREKRLETALIKHLCNGSKHSGRIRALDFGMGWGTWCLAAQDWGYVVCGLELSEQRIAYCRSKGIRVLDKLSDQAGNFHYISTEQVFEHVTEPVPLLRELVEHLEPGGIIRISVPNGRSFERKYQKGNWSPGKDEVHPLEHINCFQHDSLLRLGETAGLKKMGVGRLVQAHLAIAIKGNIAPLWSVKNFLKHSYMTAKYFEKVN